MQTLNKNNLHVNEETCNHFPSPMASSNMFTTTYYPANLSKYDFHPDSPCRAYLHSWKAAEPVNSPKHHGEVFSSSKKIEFDASLFKEVSSSKPPSHHYEIFKGSVQITFVMSCLVDSFAFIFPKIWDISLLFHINLKKKTFWTASLWISVNVQWEGRNRELQISVLFALIFMLSPQWKTVTHLTVYLILLKMKGDISVQFTDVAVSFCWSKMTVQTFGTFFSGC